MDLFTLIRIVHRGDNLFGESAKHLQQPNPLDIHRARYTLFLFLEQLRKTKWLTLDELLGRVQVWPLVAKNLRYPVDDTFYCDLYVDIDPKGLVTIKLRAMDFVCAIVRKAADTKSAANSAGPSL